MPKQKALSELEAERAACEQRLFQLQHKAQQYESRIAYYDRRNAGAYSQKARINNLKEMNALFNYLMENGIHDLDTLENRVDALRQSSDTLKEKLDSQTARMKGIRKLPDYLAT